MRRAKIVCTIGPATESAEQIQALVDAGMDVARLNRSHGDTEVHQRVYDNVRAAAQASGRSVAVLVDLQGPKIRLGRFIDDEKHILAVGDVFTITTDDVEGTKERVSTTHKGLTNDARVGDPILIDDGKVLVRVTAVEGPRVVTRVEVPGPVSNNKGLNLPGVAVSVPAMSDKDEEDLRWALTIGADIIALSFVRSAEDYTDVRRIMEEENRVVPVIAKIEKPQAVENLAEIIAAFDGIMVARGDLGVELPLEQVPAVQTRAIKLARERARPVIVATQMLESMINSPRPTRAEVSDVAGAVAAGADAVMLSAETSVGAYPIDTVATMSRIVAAAEESSLRAEHHLSRMPTTTGGAIARAAAEVGAIVGAKALVAFTMTGETARRLARYRSPIPLLAFTTDPAIRSQLALTWGVETFIVAEARHTDDMVHEVDSALVRLNRCAIGDKIVIVAGSPPGSPGKTNGLRVHRIGDAINLSYP